MEVRKLCKSYDDRPVLQNVSFTAENGVTALWGPSGAGKTTLLRIRRGGGPGQRYIIRYRCPLERRFSGGSAAARAGRHGKSPVRAGAGHG
ncbi:MAG: ATP-binding cassette domain-containing protein [Oscillospiraceae bacterium]